MLSIGNHPNITVIQVSETLYFTQIHIVFTCISYHNHIFHMHDICFLFFVATKAQCTASVVSGAALLQLSLSLGNAMNGGSGKEEQGSKKYGLQYDIHTVDGKNPAP